MELYLDRPRVLVLSGAGGWHEQQLKAALTAAGCEVTGGSLTDIDLCANSATGFRGLGFEAELPHAVFVRGVAAGSFEQVTRRLDLLHAFEMSGIRVVNTARTIERTVDKGMTSFLLHRHGVATPAALTTESRARAREFTETQLASGHRLVAKPLFGSQGRGLVLVERIDQLPQSEQVAGVWHLQQFVERSQKWFDWRVFVCRSKVITRMTRHSPHWITNRARGAQCQRSDDDDDVVETALRATEALGCWYAGVDLVRDDSHRPQVLEVNGVPAWRGVATVTGVDVAKALAINLVTELKSGTLPGRGE